MHPRGKCYVKTCVRVRKIDVACLFFPFYLCVAFFFPSAACSGVPPTSSGAWKQGFTALQHLRLAVLLGISGHVYAHFISDNKDYGICLHHQIFFLYLQP